MNEEQKRVLQAQCHAETLRLGRNRDAMLRGINADSVQMEILAKLKGQPKRKTNAST